MLKNLPQYLAYTRKAIIQILGLAASLLALGVLPDKYAGWVAGAVAFLTTVLHFLTPNAEAPGSTPAVEEFVPHDENEVGEIPDEWQPAGVVTAGQVAAEQEFQKPPSI
jgi:hypothetical protein